MNWSEPFGLAAVRRFVIMVAAGVGGAAAAQTTLHVNGSCGDDSWSGLSRACQAPDGPKATIQAALNAASPGDTVLVADGVYSGAGNFGLMFPPPSIITLRSENGPEHCVIDGAGAGSVFSFVLNEPPEAVVDGFTITGAIYHALFMHHECRATVKNCVITGNASDHNGAGVYIENTSAPTFIDCVISENSGPGGPGVFAVDGAEPTLINCELVRNSAGVDGGALYFRTFTAPTLVNCLVANNTAGEYGGGIYVGSGAPELINVTFSGNAAGDAGGGIFAAGPAADVVVVGSVLWGDNAPEGAEIALETDADRDGASLSVRYSIVEGGEAGVLVEPGSMLDWGAGNLDLDPLFAHSGGRDFRLAPGSAAIDAADNLALPADVFDLDGDGDTAEPLPIDLDGNARHHNDAGTDDIGNHGPPGPLADMGAYEFQGFSCRADFNGDDDIDTRDVTAFLNAWTSGDPRGDFNRDGETDTRDVLAFLNTWRAGCP